MVATTPMVEDIDAVRRTNNFDALRLLAAVGVVVGHAQILRGYPDRVPTVLGLAPHYLGVSVFFAISGWLITGSWLRSRSVPQYVTSRALRILPLLWSVVLVSVLVIGPLVTDLPLGSYFRSAQTWRYLVNMVFLPADGLAGVFTGTPYPGVVNGSLWTLRAEVVCYAVVLVVGLGRRRVRTIGLAAFAVGAIALVVAGDVTVAGSSLSAAAGAWIYFAVAALLRLHVPRRWLRPDVAALSVVLWWIVSTTGATWSMRVSWIVLPYAVLAIGLASWPGVRRAARFGDLSYGTYLLAFPVQQLVLQSLGVLPAVLDMVVVCAISALLAGVTWHFLEKPALELRHRLPWFGRPSDLRQPAESVSPATP